MKKREELDRLRGLSDTDLNDEVMRLKESLFRLNFRLSLGEVDAVKTLRREKKSLARVQTIISERERTSAAP